MLILSTWPTTSSAFPWWISSIFTSFLSFWCIPSLYRTYYRQITMQVLGQVQISTRGVQPNCVIDEKLVCIHYLTLENVAIANALQLEAGRRRTVPIRFNFVALGKFYVAQPIRCRLRVFLLLIRYVTPWPSTLTPWPWPLTFHLWPWTFVVCRLCHGQTLYQIWAQSGNPRRSYCSLNLIDLMTLNMYHVLRYALG